MIETATNITADLYRRLRLRQLLSAGREESDPRVSKLVHGERVSVLMVKVESA